MKITNITKQVKREARYSIYIDGKFAFGLSELGLLNSGLHVGQELSKEQFKKLEQMAKQDKAYDRALNLLSIRQRSEWELLSYLQRKGYSPETTEEILNKLRNRGLMNDLAFAQAWVNDRRLLKPMSKRRLQAELRQKRLSNDIIDQVLQEDETDERQVLRDLVERKRARYPDKLKLMQYLVRQGYNYDDIKAVLEEKEPD